MRIGLISGEYPPMQGGVGDYTHELAKALLDLGHEVHVITRSECGDEGQRTQDRLPPAARGEHVARLNVHPIVPHWGWRSYRRVIDLARRLSIDVLNIQYQAAAYDIRPAINFFPLLAPRLSPKRHPKIVVTFHDLKVPYLFPKAGPLRDWVVTLLARHADAAIVTNHADELELNARRVHRVERIPIGSNIGPSLPGDYDRHTWRARLGITPGDFLLGFFGFFNARKGVEILIRALALLSQGESTKAPSGTNLAPPCHLLFIGGTVGSSDPTNRAYADRMSGLISELGLDDRVHYTGYVPETEVSAAFAAVDLCVLPYADGISFHHGTLMAALAHGQAIASTQSPIPLPELVHGENVWLVPPGDAGALASAIATLAADPERRRRLACGAAALSAQFTWGHIAARTADLYQSVKREP
jgi:glycosyltransferase involved in cell wall biosynthesis